MDSIAVTKPDMAVMKGDRLGLSLFGLLSLAFGDEVRTRSAWQTGLCREVPLELLEEDEPAPVSESERELHLDVDLRVVLENLKQEHRQADGRQKQVTERILERVYLLERRVSETVSAGAHINVRIDPLQAGRSAAKSGQAENVSAAVKQSGTSNAAPAVQDEAVLSAIQAAAENAQQRAQAVWEDGKAQAGRTAHPVDGMRRRRIGVQAAAAVWQARRAAVGGLWRTVKQEQPGRLSSPFTPVSWSTAAPAGEGWMPRWQEAYPGFGSQKETGGGRTAGGSILLPDQLRLRRQRALQQAAEATVELFAADMHTADGSLVHLDNTAPEAGSARQDEAVRRLVQRLDRAVEQAVSRSVRWESTGTGEGASPVPQESPAEDARMAQPSGKTDGSRSVQEHTARDTWEAQAKKQAAAAHGKTDVGLDAMASGSATARTERSGTAAQNGYPAQRAPDETDMAIQAARLGTAAPQAGLPQEALLHRMDGQDNAQHVGEAARTERSGTAAQNGYPAQRAPDETDMAIQAARLGTAAPQAGLPQEALLHPMHGQDNAQRVGETDERASVQEQANPAVQETQEGTQAAKASSEPVGASHRSSQPFSRASRAVSGRTEAQTASAAVRMEQPGAAAQTAQTGQYARETIDPERQTALPGAAAPQVPLPLEELLHHHTEEQDHAQAFRQADAGHPIQGQADSAVRTEHQQPPLSSAQGRAEISGQAQGSHDRVSAAVVSGSAAACTVSAAAQIKQPGETVQQDRPLPYIPDDRKAAKQTALPGAAAPQAALPPEALLYRAEMQDGSSSEQEKTSPAPERGQPDRRMLTGRDKTEGTDTISPAAPLAGTAPQKEAAPEAGTVPPLMTADQSVQKPSDTDQPRNDAAPQTKAAPLSYAAPNEQPAFPAEPLIHRETVFNLEQNNQPGQVSTQGGEPTAPVPRQALPLTERAAGQQTHTWQTGAVGRTEDTFPAQQPVRTNAAARTDSRTAERPMHAAALPQKNGKAQEQTAFDRALPVKTAGGEGYHTVSEPLTWRTEADPSAPQERRTETTGKVRNSFTAPADTAHAGEKKQTTAVPPHRGRTDEIEYSPAHPGRSITGKTLSGQHPAPGTAGGTAPADAGLVYRTDAAQQQTAAQERQSGLPVQAKAIGTAAAGHTQRPEQPRTALCRSTEEMLSRPMKPVQTTLLRLLQVGNTAAVRSMETFTDTALQPGEMTSRRAAVLDGDELSYLPLQAAEQKTDRKAPSQTSALPDWAQRFLQQPAGVDTRKTQRFSAARQQPAAPPGQIEWTAPSAVPKAAPIVFRENKQPEAQRPAAPARLSDSELRRAADKVYRMIEDRLRRELRRSGK